MQNPGLLARVCVLLGFNFFRGLWILVPIEMTRSCINLARSLSLRWSASQRSTDSCSHVLVVSDSGIWRIISTVQILRKNSSHTHT